MDLEGVKAGRCLVSQAPSRWGLFRAIGLIAVLATTQMALLSASAQAHAQAAPNPSSNYKPGPLPSSCSSSPTGAKCINGAVYYLNRARGRLHLGPYKLPATFVKLGPERQVLI